MNTIHVGRNGVYKLLKGLTVHKAAGLDAVPTRFLHDFALELAPIMTELFQLSIDIGKVRNKWRKAYIFLGCIRLIDWRASTQYS